jgi:DNA topoisomerase 2-associated protein PAT1
MDDPGGHYPLDRKLAQLRADFGEDIAVSQAIIHSGLTKYTLPALTNLPCPYLKWLQVYDYADDGLIESTAGLEEDMNDFNDETFGMDTVGQLNAHTYTPLMTQKTSWSILCSLRPVSEFRILDKDFDFSGSTAQYLGVSEPPKQKPQGGASWTTMSSLLADREPGGSSTPRPSSPPRRKAGPVSLLDDPLLAPKSTISHRHSSGPFTPPKPPGSEPAATISKPHKIRTLEEIEAELRANSAAKNSIPSSSLPPQALTLEQVEAALLANHERKLATTTASRSSTPHALPFSQPSLQGRTQSVQHIQRNLNLQPVMSSPAMAPMTRPTHTPSSLPPHNHPAHPAHPQHSEWLRLQQQQHQMYTNIPTQQHMPIQPLMSRLPAMPSPPQVLPGRHLSNPPGVGFGPNMRAGSVPPRSATQTPFVQTSNVTIPVEELRSAAEARIQEQERREALRRRKAAKIAEMSKYNNLMSQGDKDFITRIQVSQLVNPSHGQAGFDPYADDFYFHVYSAIRASRMAAQHQFHTATAGRRTHTASSDERISQDYDGVGGFEVRNSRTVERRLTRRDYAMIRMAQNVQRIIDHAKERPKMSQGPHLISLEQFYFY